MVGARIDARAWRNRPGHIDLAAPADAPPAADRIEIDAKLARGGEQARPFGEFAALAGGREDDAIWVKGGP